MKHNSESRYKPAQVLLGYGLATALFYGAMACHPYQAEASSTPESFGDRIIAADQEPQNWLSHGRNYSETRYSPLTDINAKTINQLGLSWFYDLDTDRGQEATPLVVDGILYTTSAWSKVQAFNAETGEFLWQFDPEVPGEAAVKGCCDVVNRGVAYWNGRVYFGSFDGRLFALNAKTGKQIWSVVTVDQKLNYTITGAPRIVKGKVIIGNGGAEFGVRGYVTAYDWETGEKVWRFYTVPGEPKKSDGEVSDPVLEQLATSTWTGEWWTEKGGRGGGTVWDSMAYDPELDLLYLGVGNGSYWNSGVRSPGGGDNLFISSILALKPDTGEYVWHFQQVPGEEWDYTATQHMILANILINGETRKVIMQAPKNGFFYVLDRTNGKFISAAPYTTVNWATGIDQQTGKPLIKPEARYSQTGQTWIAIPSAFGGHNWQPMAYNPNTGLVYIPTLEVPGAYKTPATFKRQPTGMNFGLDISSMTPPTAKEEIASLKSSLKGRLTAWNPVTQEKVWESNHSGPWNGGVLTTAGNLVFQGDGDGFLNAFNAKTGEKLWSFNAQSGIQAPPVTYAVNGIQYLSVVVGYGGSMPMNMGELLTRDGRQQFNKSRVMTFKLGGGAALPDTLPPIKQALNPPPQFASKEAIAEGGELYHSVCSFCHGGGATGSGLLQDLRYSAALSSPEAWAAIVYDGAFSAKGMVSFRENFSPNQIEKIRAYVVDRAQAKVNQDKAAVSPDTP